jgi:hypothetical protein
MKYNKLKKDKKKRLQFLVFEKRLLVFQSFVQNLLMSKSLNWASNLKNLKLLNTNRKVRISKLCIITAKKSQVYGKVSRLTFLRVVKKSFISGAKKACW